MSGTRTDYYVSGAYHAERRHAAGTLQREGFPVTFGKMAIAMNGSWQAMAWKEGFSDKRERLLGMTAPAERPSVTRRAKQIDSMVAGYIAAMLWSSSDTVDGEPVESLDGFEVSGEAMATALLICTRFYDANRTDLGAYADLFGTGKRRDGTGYDYYECAGHDLWLTTNGHGTGFWDRGMGRVGKRLAAQCGYHKAFLPVDAYVGDDRLVYFS